jgi:hypothetical protein
MKFMGIIPKAGVEMDSGRRYAAFYPAICASKNVKLPGEANYEEMTLSYT